jgi:hypothetical protein
MLIVRFQMNQSQCDQGSLRCDMHINHVSFLYGTAFGIIMIKVLLKHRLGQVNNLASLHISDQSLIKFKVNKPLHLIPDP